jgi:hypothetical protein
MLLEWVCFVLLLSPLFYILLHLVFQAVGFLLLLTALLLRLVAAMMTA